MKVCAKCKETKQESDFSKASRYKDGLYYHCKKCSNEEQRQNRKKRQSTTDHGTCESCLEPFESITPARRFCNQKCAARARRSDPNFKRESGPIQQQRRDAYIEMRHEAMTRVGRGVLACSKCGCTEQSILEINHLFGAEKTLSRGKSGMYRKEPLSTLLRRIRDGTRSVDDLNLLCKPCNHWYEVVRKFPDIASEYTIKWEPPNLWKPTANDFDSRVLVPSYSSMLSRDEVDVGTNFTQRFRLSVPIVASPMSCVCETALAKAMNTEGAGFVLHRYMRTEEQVDMVRTLKSYSVRPVAVAISTNDYDRVQKLVGAGADILVLDISHGDSAPAFDTLRNIRKDWGNAVDVMSGNIVTAEAAARYDSAEASALRVGIGIGSVCTTRKVTGIGRNQIDAIEAVRQGAPSLPICSDGGIRSGNDVVKALAAGANTVMVGSILAPTQESPAERITYASRTYVKYFGMASTDAMQKRIERTGENASSLIHVRAPEGRSSLIQYNGDRVVDVLKRVVTDVKIGFAYLGAHNISEAQKSPDWGLSVEGIS